MRRKADFEMYTSLWFRATFNCFSTLSSHSNSLGCHLFWVELNCANNKQILMMNMAIAWTNKTHFDAINKRKPESSKWGIHGRFNDLWFHFQNNKTMHTATITEEKKILIPFCWTKFYEIFEVLFLMRWVAACISHSNLQIAWSILIDVKCRLMERIIAVIFFALPLKMWIHTEFVHACSTAHDGEDRTLNQFYCY